MSDSQEMAPAFTAKMRAADSVLAAEDSNPLFDAFRRYRELYPAERHRTARWRVWRMPAAFAWIAAVGTAWLTMSSRSPFMVPLWLAIGLPPLILLMTSNLLTMARVSAMLFQANTQQLDDRRRGRARDLWLAGISGRMVLEAAYLEAAQRSGRIRAVMALILPAVPLVLGVATVGVSVPGAVIGVCGIGLFVWLARPAFFQIELLVRVRVLALQVEYWARPPSLGRDLGYLLKIGGSTLPFSLWNMAVFLPPVVVVVGAIITRRFAPTSTGGIVIHEAWAAVVVAWLLLMGALFRLAARWLRRLNTRRWEKANASADAAFSTFFRRVLMEDPDG